MEAWHREIIDLHDFFTGYLTGTLEPSSISRMDDALATGFTIVSPTGNESDRAAIIGAVTSSHGQAGELSIEIPDAHLLGVHGDVTLARYIERHVTPGESTDRLSTVAFVADPDGPNGLRWLFVHETLIDL